MRSHISVTNHALLQWRGRVAVSGAATANDIVDVLRRAVPLLDGQCSDIRRRAGKRYFFHADTGSVFVVEPVSSNSCRLVTIIVPGQQRNFLLPKTKEHRRAVSRAVPVAEEPLSDADASAKYSDLTSSMRLLEARLGTMRNWQARQALIDELDAMKQRVACLKPAHQRQKAAASRDAAWQAMFTQEREAMREQDHPGSTDRFPAIGQETSEKEGAES